MLPRIGSGPGRGATFILPSPTARLSRPPVSDREEAAFEFVIIPAEKILPPRMWKARNGHVRLP